MRSFVTIIMTLSLVAATPHVQAQQTPRQHAEIALDYTWMHSNAPPGGCGCFSFEGGSATLAVPLRSSPFSVVADVTVSTASSNTPGFYGSLQLETFTAGLRYTPWLRKERKWQPFLQAQAGLAHAGGSLASAPYPAAANAGGTFGGSAGGGLDLRLRRHIALRLVDAEYVATTFNNNANSRQNSVRLSSGLVFRF